MAETTVVIVGIRVGCGGADRGGVGERAAGVAVQHVREAGSALVCKLAHRSTSGGATTETAPAVWWRRRARIRLTAVRQWTMSRA